jgi:heptosyltransferase-2
MQHPALNLAGQTSVREVTAFMQGCDLFIGNDAGLMHLASSVGTPVVAIFGPTNSRAWSPFGTDETKAGEIGSVVVQAELELPCRPCLYRGMELGTRTGCAPRPCLTEIKPGQVVEAAEIFLRARVATNYET